MSDRTPLVVYVAGMPWDGAEGTDRRLVTALSAHVRVLWVDPPASLLRRAPGGGRSLTSPLNARTDQVAPQVERLQVVGPPLVTRAPVRSVVNALLARAVRSAVAERGGAQAVVVANPLVGLRGQEGVTGVYYVTDDWPAGAGLMGLSRRAIERAERRSCAAADVVAAVSPSLADRLAGAHGISVSVLANGCAVAPAADGVAPVDLGLPGPVVGLVGQVNERLDLDLLHAVADRGLSLALVGPRRERSAPFAEALDRLLGRPNVRWFGLRPAAELPGFLAAFRVGVTPYVDSEFNRASFPLKTLDYLAAGLPCVATPSPALDWLDTDLVHSARDPEDFADEVERLARADVDLEEVRRRVELAGRHTWDARAEQLLTAVGIHDAEGPRASAPETTAAEAAT